MDSNDFQMYGHKLIDWAVNYMETLPNRPPTTKEKPGWLWKVVPKTAPEQPEPFEHILRDLEPVVCHGMTHWQHPQFFAYFPAGNSWPSILGDVFSNAMGANGSSWYSCPVVTELETIVMDWCCKFLGLPRFFLSSYSLPKSEGQGVLQCSASEAIFYSMIWARHDALKKLRAKYPNKPKAVLLNMLVAYCNNECHCCVERASMMGCVRMRKLKADNLGVIRSYTLRHAIKEDLAKGLVPFFHCAIIGSTGVTCADDLMEVGPLCQKYDMWLHVDAAYAGSSFVLPEFSHLKQGFEYVWSTNVNTNKWMLCNFEASLHWVRYKNKAVDAFAGDANSVLKYSNGLGPDLRHYGVASSRRLRAFKLWCVIRNYGVEGIRRYIRNHLNLAKLFEILKGYNSLTSRLMEALNASHKIHMVPSHFHNQVVIRFALCYEHATEQDVDRAWRTIDEYASVILREYEREHSEDLAMKRTFYSQHQHDEAQDEVDDPEIKKEEAEAARVLKDLDFNLQNDLVVLEADEAGVDGVIDVGNEKAFEDYDTHLRSHPSSMNLNVDEEYVDPFLAAQRVQSMLHLTVLNATEANVRKKIKVGHLAL